MPFIFTLRSSWYNLNIVKKDIKIALSTHPGGCEGKRAWGLRVSALLLPEDKFQISLSSLILFPFNGCSWSLCSCSPNPRKENSCPYWPLYKGTESINRKLLHKVDSPPSPLTKVSFKNWNRNICVREVPSEREAKTAKNVFSATSATSLRTLSLCKYKIHSTQS